MESMKIKKLTFVSGDKLKSQDILKCFNIPKKCMLFNGMDFSVTVNDNFIKKNYENSLDFNLLIDEFSNYKNLIFYKPENILSPKDQISFAYRLTNLVNQGKNILVVTNSDWILREINIIIVAQIGKYDLKKYESLSDFDDNDFILKLSDVIFYEFENNKLIKIKHDENGIDTPYLNDLINQQNERENTVYYNFHLSK